MFALKTEMGKPLHFKSVVTVICSPRYVWVKVFIFLLFQLTLNSSFKSEKCKFEICDLHMSIWKKE